MKLTFFNKQAETTQPVVSNEIETAVEVLTPTTTTATTTATTPIISTPVESSDSKVEESNTFVIPKTFEDALNDLKSSKYVDDLPVTSDEEEITDVDYEEIDDDSTSDGDDENADDIEEEDSDEDSCEDPAEAESPDEDTEEEEAASSEVTSAKPNFAFTEAEASSIDISVDGAVSIDAAINEKANSINKNIDESREETLKYVKNGFEVLSEEITEIKKIIDKNVDIDAVTKFMGDVNQLSANYLNKIKDNS